MDAVMYIFANKDLEMSHGKLAAQVAHAAVEAFRISDEKMIEAWYKGGHHAKIVLGADDDTQMLIIEQYLRDRDFQTVRIIDEGRTEIRPFSFTALGVEIVDREDEHTAATFANFKTYKSPRPDPGKHSRRKWKGFGI